MRYRVVFHPDARRELKELHRYIADNGSPGAARKFVGALRDYCLGFSTFPNRGTLRDDIGPGVRVIGFRRRVSIAFAVRGDTVWILGIYYGGRNFDPNVADEDDD